MADETKAPTTEEVRAMLVERGLDAIGWTQSYGVALSDDPRHFTPDPEASTDEERAQHAADVEAWDRGERPERNHRCDLAQPVGAMSANATPWGLGTTTMPDPVAVAALALAEHRDALAAEVVTIVRELGGKVEGLPTQTINYLQRIRALRAIEADRDALATAAAAVLETRDRWRRHVEDGERTKDPLVWAEHVAAMERMRSALRKGRDDG